MPLLILGFFIGVFIVGYPESAVSAGSGQRVMKFQLPAQDLSQALKRLAFQTEQQVLFSADQLRDKKSKTVVGLYSFPDALEIMLTGTGLVYRKERTTWLIGTPAWFDGKCSEGCSDLDSTSARSDAEYIEEFIVTARRREEQLQKTPVTVNVARGNQLGLRNINDADELSRLFPNLSLKVASPINTGFSIRGVGTDNFHSNANPAVGFYLDEISLITPFSGEFPLFDIERIEVMRGPQNTLYGRNTTGGAVAIISRKPIVGGPRNGYGRFTLGNNGRRDFEAAYETGLYQSASIRVALQSQSQDGVFNNLLGGNRGSKRRNSGRVQLLWDYSSNTEILINFNVSDGEGTLPGRRAVGAFSAAGDSGCQLLNLGGVDNLFGGVNSCTGLDPRSGALVNVATNDWETVNEIGPSNTEIDFIGGFVRLVYSNDLLSISSITSYDKTDVLMDTINASATSYQTFYAGNVGEWEVFSQDFRLSSLGTESVRWILGTHISLEQDFIATPLRQVDVFEHVGHDQDVTVISYYGHLELDVTDAIGLSLGLRHTFDRKKSDSQWVVFENTDIAPELTLSIAERLALAKTSATCPPLGCLSRFPLTQNAEAWGATAVFDYQLGSEILLYAAYSRGFKFGGFNMRASAFLQDDAQTAVRPEHLDSFEIGVKSSPFAKRMTLNAAVFHYLWKDQQKFDSDPTTGIAAFLNIPRSELLGAELEMRWQVSKGLFTEIAAGWIDSELLEAGDLNSVEEGVELNLTPGLTLNALVNKQFEFGHNTVSFQLDMQYSSEKYAFLLNDPAGRIDETLFVNGRFTWTFGQRQQYSMTLFADNITEEKTCGDISRLGTLTNTIVCTPNNGYISFGASLEVKL